MWVFMLVFPLLLGGQVEVQVVATNQVHCEKVRTLLKSQLDAHRSNATLTDCKPKEE